MSHPAWVTCCLSVIRNIQEQIRNNNVVIFNQARSKLTTVEVNLCSGQYQKVEDFAVDIKNRLSELSLIAPELNQLINSLCTSVDVQLATLQGKPAGHILSRITEDDFIKPLKDYQCPICTNIFIEPCLTPCGHHFCRECIIEALQHKPECPIDRKNLTGYSPFRDMAIERKIMSKTIKCPNQRIKKSEECTWKGNVSLLQEHFTSCPLEEILCEWGCRQRIERRAITVHDVVCPQRFSNCEHCQTKIHISHIIPHKLSCVMLPINCSNGGCTEKFPRKDIYRHLQVCAFSLVDCPFRGNGCHYKSNRKTMEDHLRNYIGNHLELLQQENTKLKTEKRSDLSLVDCIKLKKKIRVTRIINFEADPKNTVYKFPLFHIGGYEFELIIRKSISLLPVLNTTLICSQRQKTKPNNNQTATWPVLLSYMIFIKNQVRSSEFIESEKFDVEFKNSGEFDLRNPFLLSVIKNGREYIVQDSLKVGIRIFDLVQKTEVGYSSKSSESVSFQDSSGTFSFGKPEEPPQFSFGLPELSSPRRVAITKPSFVISPFTNTTIGQGTVPPFQGSFTGVFL